MGTLLKPPGKAMYVAPRPDWDWLRIVQRKLYARSEQDVDYVFRKLWGLVTASSQTQGSISSRFSQGHGATPSQDEGATGEGGLRSFSQHHGATPDLFFAGSWGHPG